MNKYLTTHKEPMTNKTITEVRFGESVSFIGLAYKIQMRGYLQKQKKGDSKRAASSKPTPTEMTTKPGYLQHTVQSEGSVSV